MDGRILSVKIYNITHNKITTLYKCLDCRHNKNKLEMFSFRTWVGIVYVRPSIQPSIDCHVKTKSNNSKSVCNMCNHFMQDRYSQFYKKNY